MRSPFQIAALLVVAVLFAANCYRAATQSVVHDEALTWQLYLSGPLGPIFEFYDANHHFLATVLQRISVSLFGFSELALRLPTLIAGAWYFWTAFRLSLFLFGNGLLFLISVFLLSANPLILDFLVAARGYGLALAFFLYALWRLLRYLAADPQQPASRKLLYQAAAGLSLSVASNLTFFFPALVLAVLFMELAGRAQPAPKPVKPARKRTRKAPAPSSRFAEMRHFLLPILAFAFLFFLATPLSNARAEDFYAGVGSLWDSLRNLVQVSFAHNSGVGGINHPPAWWLRLLAWLLPGTVLAALVLSANALCRRQALDRIRLLLALTSGTIAGSILLLVAAHYLMGFPYPADRTGIYFLPLQALCLAGLARLARVARYACLGLLLLFCAEFALQWNTSHFFVWRYDADSKTMLEKLQAAGRPVRLGISWQLEPSFNFYRATRSWSWLAPLNRSGPDGDYDYYALIEADHALMARRALRPLYQGLVSRTILAAPPRQ